MKDRPRKFVYVIHAKGTDRYKVGLTGKPPRARLNAMQTGSPHPLRIVAYVPTHYASEIEQEMHSRNADCRLHGEWFRWTIERRDSEIQHLMNSAVGNDMALCAFTIHDLGKLFDPYEPTRRPWHRLLMETLSDKVSSMVDADEEAVRELVYRLMPVGPESCGSIQDEAKRLDAIRTRSN